MPTDNDKPAYGYSKDDDPEARTSLLTDEKGERNESAAPSASASRKRPEGCSALRVLHWVGLVFIAGYFGYSCGMLLGFAHRGNDGLRVCITYIYMMIFAVVLACAEFRFPSFLRQFKFLSTPFGLAMFYIFMGVFALVDDIAWWKWVLFSPMVFMGGAYVLAGSCAHDNTAADDPVANPSLADKEQ
uniref:Transmembrane protein n=1 Tax=Lotharella oceanica TaxID=641309 RepID=A0A7S2U3T6_9EUKA|mmetsp:Transcript_687/g.1281  ORF Transcript_687/g.1281 Transcript_687/m.1281 type:complete len:187 (+) Transcript_687:149-709(+)